MLASDYIDILAVLPDSGGGDNSLLRFGGGVRLEIIATGTTSLG